MHAHDRALGETPDGIICSRLTEFRDNHRQHISVLSDQIRALGGKAPKLSRDFKGYVIEAFTALRTVTGMKGALKALKTTEEITNRYYGQVVSKDVPPDLKEILRKHFSDEKIHLDYINSNLQASDSSPA